MTERDDRYNASPKGKARTLKCESRQYRKGYRAGYKTGLRRGLQSARADGQEESCTEPLDKSSPGV